MAGKRIIDYEWWLDPQCVLERGKKGDFDDSVAGDPCIVWDDEADTWRMFYFAMNSDKSCVTGMALSKSAEEIGPGDWAKTGMVKFVNPEDLFTPNGWHKWWVVMDAYKPNYAAKIDGKYFAFFASTIPDRRIQAAWAEKLGGPWMVVKTPVIAPGEQDAPDSLFCDTPSAFWFEESGEIMIFYMAYPKTEQKALPFSPFGSCIMAGFWRPFEEKALVGQPVLLPEKNKWTSGWLGGFQLIHDDGFYALINASPTPPENDSDREPAPSLGGFAVCRSANAMPDTEWSVFAEPIKRIEALSKDELSAGIAVNLWRHHLLITPGGKKRIFVNSGNYGTEQMYSYT